jgi:predicted RND superfamily exporter protein
VTARRIIAGLVAIAAAAGVLLGLVNLRMDTSTESFLPSGDPALHAVEQKARSFGGDPIVVLLKSRSPREFILERQKLFGLLGIEGKLAKTPNVAGVYGPGTVLNQVASSAQNLLAQIAGRRAGLAKQTEQAALDAGQSPAAAKGAANDATARFDVRYGSLLVKGLPAGLPTLYNPNFAKTVVFDQRDGQVRPQWSFVVPAPDTVAILVRPREDLDQSGVQQLVAQTRHVVADSKLAPRQVTVSGVPAVTAGLADEVTAEIPLLGSLVALAVALRFLLVPTGMRMRRRLWPLVAALLGTAATVAAFGLIGRPLSFGVVALLPILLGVGSSIPLYMSMLRNTRRVVTVAAASAASFASLVISPIPFVKELGVALAAGMVLTTALTLLVKRRLAGDGDHAAAEADTPGAHTGTRRRRIGGGVALVLAGAAGWALLPGLPVQANPEQLAAGLPALNDAQQVQREIGSSGEVSVVLRGGDVAGPASFRWAKQAEDVIVSRYGDQLRPVLTLPDLLKFLGGNPSGEQLSSAIGLMPKYLTSAVLNDDTDSSVMIFGLKLQDLGQQSRLLKEVQQALPPPPPGSHADLVGLPVAANRGYDLVSEGRYPANLAGIVVAGLVLLAGLRRRSDALRAVAAALLATGWGLAGIWLLGGALTPLTVALGSLVTVTGCEFLVLLADRDIRGSKRLKNSVALACLTSAIGYLALAASGLSVLRDFGLVLTGAVVLSYAAARAVLWLAPVGSAGQWDGPDEPATGGADTPQETIEGNESATLSGAR